jgi:gas vesicle protein
MSRKKKQPSPLSSLFTKQQPKTNRVKKGAVAGAAVGAAIGLIIKQKKSQP